MPWRVAHPPGYPLHLLLTRAAAMASRGVLTPAHAANFVSCLLGAGAAALLTETVHVVTGSWAMGSGAVAGITFSLSDLVWLYSSGSEVFALNNFLCCSACTPQLDFLQQIILRVRMPCADGEESACFAVPWHLQTSIQLCSSLRPSQPLSLPIPCQQQAWNGSSCFSLVSLGFLRMHICRSLSVSRDLGKCGNARWLLDAYNALRVRHFFSFANERAERRHGRAHRALRRRADQPHVWCATACYRNHWFSGMDDEARCIKAVVWRMLSCLSLDVYSSISCFGKFATVIADAVRGAPPLLDATEHHRRDLHRHWDAASSLYCSILLEETPRCVSHLRICGRRSICWAAV